MRDRLVDRKLDIDTNKMSIITAFTAGVQPEARGREPCHPMVDLMDFYGTTCFCWNVGPALFSKITSCSLPEVFYRPQICQKCVKNGQEESRDPHLKYRDPLISRGRLKLETSNFAQWLSVTDLEGAEPAPPPPLWATDRRRYGTPNKSTRWCIMATPSSVNL